MNVWKVAIQRLQWRELRHQSARADTGQKSCSRNLVLSALLASSAWAICNRVPLLLEAWRSGRQGLGFHLPPEQMIHGDFLVFLVSSPSSNARVMSQALVE